MIYSLLLISSIFSISVHSFYITNAAALEQCVSQTITYSDKFDSTKMLCLNQAWRQTFIFLEYSCIGNTFTRIWTIQTKSGKNFNFPSIISLITNTQYTRFDKTNSNDDLTIEENSKTFDPNNNQLTTYLWTSLGIGPQCRIKYTIMKDICTANKGAVGAKFTDFICYYGKQTFNFQQANQRQIFDNLIDSNRKPGSHIPLGSNNTQPIPNHSPMDPGDIPVDPSIAALNAGKPSFWTKYKRYIIIGGFVLLVIIIILIIIIVIRSSRSSKEKISEKISDESTIE